MTVTIRDMVGKRLRLVTPNSLRPKKGISPLSSITWRVTGISVERHSVYLVATGSKQKDTVDWFDLETYIGSKLLEIV